MLRVPSNFTLTLAAGTKMTCAEAVESLLKHKRRWEVRSAGSGSKGERSYAWAWLATASARHHLLVRRHLGTGELAFHYCFVPGGKLLTKTRLIRAAGLRWPVEENFGFGKDFLASTSARPALHRGPPPRRAGHGRAGDLRRHRRAAARPHRHPAPPPSPDQPPPAEPGIIPLTIPEIKRLLAALTTRPLPRWLSSLVPGPAVTRPADEVPQTRQARPRRRKRLVS